MSWKKWEMASMAMSRHWAVIGPQSRPLHLQLVGLVTPGGLVDTIAERALALGFVLDGQAQAVGAGSQLTPVAQGAIEDHVVVRELTRRIADVSERVPVLLQYIGEVDLVSQSVLMEVVRKLEKQQSMLRIQLEERA